MVAFSPIAWLPVAALEDETASAAPIYDATQESVGDNVYLIQLYPFQPGVTIAPWINAIAMMPIATLPDGEEASSGITPIYFSDRSWVSKPTDTLPNIFFDGRAVEPLSIDRAMPIDPTGDRRVAVNVGAIDLVNTDGALDAAVRNFSIDARQVIVKFGRRTDPYGNFGTIFSGVGVEWQANDSSVRIEIRDSTFLLNVPLQTVLYGGTGGSDGTSANIGKAIPHLYGKCRNITPVQFDPTNLVWQFHDRLVLAVDAVRDQGVALTFDADYPNYAALIAASIPAGRYATCLAKGMVRTASNPVQLTLDARGDATGGYVDNTADVVKRILIDRGSIPSGKLNLGSFSSISQSVPGVVGIYFGGGQVPTVAEAVSSLMGGIAGWWGANRSGLLTIGRLSQPSTPSYNLTTLHAIREPARVSLPANISPCAYQVVVGFQRNWTQQQGGDLTAAVSAANRFYWGSGYLTQKWSDSTRALRDVTAQAITIVSYFDNASDALNLAQRLGDIYQPGRILIEVPVKTIGHLFDLGDFEQFTWPRYGLNNGRAMVVVGISESASKREVVLTLFG